MKRPALSSGTLAFLNQQRQLPLDPTSTDHALSLHVFTNIHAHLPISQPLFGRTKEGKNQVSSVTVNVHRPERFHQIFPAAGPRGSGACNRRASLGMQLVTEILGPHDQGIGPTCVPGPLHRNILLFWQSSVLVDGRGQRAIIMIPRLFSSIT